MIASPWEKWIPGVLSETQIKKLCDDGFIIGAENPEPETVTLVPYKPQVGSRVMEAAVTVVI